MNMSPIRFTTSLLTLTLVCACGGGSGGGGTPPTPALTAPSAGAVISGTRMITWVSPQNPNTVEIRLSNNGGSSFATQLAAAAPDNGSFSWDTTGVADGATYRLRIIPTDGNSTVGAPFGNAGNFTVDNTAPVIALTSPQAGGVFGGNSARVTWTTTDANPGTVEVRLSSDSGVTYPTVLAAAAPDNGEFRFNATGFAEGMTYRIRVTPTDQAGNVGAPDESSGDAEMDNTLPTISLTSPVGGEMLASLHNVTYTMSDANADHVEVFLSSDSGATFPETLALDATVAGPYVWNTAVHPDGTTYRIRVVGVDEAGNRSLPADSPADFTLENIVLKQNGYYLDSDLSSTLNTGDEIFLAFNEEIVFNGPSEVDFQMFVTGDSLGTGGVFTDENLAGEMSIAVGTGMSFRTRGTFDPMVIAAGSPSGIDVASPITPDAIENTSGTDVAPIGGVDLESGFIEARDESGSDESTSCDVGDLNGDGKLDFVIGRNAGLGVAVRLDNGSGQYPLSAGTPLGTDTVTDVVLGDIDNDGDLDIVAGNAGPNRVYLNDGLGAFTDSGQVLGTGITLSLGLADFDQDGDLDLVEGNDFSSPGRVYTNVNGVFTQTAQALSGFNTNDLAIGDVDGDGDLDVLFGNNGGGAFNRMWLNDGAGNFTQGSQVLQCLTTRVALGDIDGDGDLDVVVAVSGQNEVSFNDGNGNFSDTAQVFSNGNHRGLALHDFDEDGDLDALITKFTDRDELWLNDGTGRFSQRMTQNIGNSSAVDVALGDFDGDGDMDYFAPGGLPDDDIVWHGSVTGVFGSTTLVQGADVDMTVADTRASALIDADRDGDLDLLSVRDGDLGLQLNAGDGTFGASSALGGATSLDSHLHVADVTGDGIADVIRSSAGSANTELFVGNGTGGFTLQAMAFGATASLCAATGDLDGDGDIDVVLGMSGTADLVFLGDGAGAFTQSGNSFNSDQGQALSVADWDRDGDLDVLVGTDVGPKLATNDGAGAFMLSSAFNADDVIGLTAADVDRDGDLDALQTNAGSASRVLLGNGAGGFPTSTTFGGNNTTAQVLADINHDGDLDVVLGSSGAFDNEVRLGNGAGTFAVVGQTLGTADCRSLVLADLDRDGGWDLIQGLATLADAIWSID